MCRLDVFDRLEIRSLLVLNILECTQRRVFMYCPILQTLFLGLGLRLVASFERWHQIMSKLSLIRLI